MLPCTVTISQESFDALVAEGIEEFDMTREGAVKDAIQQFTAQGILHTLLLMLCALPCHYIR
jgi:hypothetical protein